MAVKPTVTWDERIPAGSDNINAGDDRIRELKCQIREVVGVDHDFPSSGQAADNGQHLRVTLQEQANLGTGAEGVPILGAQTVDGEAELVYTDENDNDIELTSVGRMGSTSTSMYADDIDVAGDVIVSGTATLNGTLDVTGNSTFGGTVGVTGAFTGDGLVQVLNTMTGATANGSTPLPFDDSIPQITEGTEYMTQAITPTDATNVLKIEVVAFMSNNIGELVSGALFQDTTAGALAVSCADQSLGNNGICNINFTYYMVAGTTSETTFRFRAGRHTAGTCTFNGTNAVGRKFGGVLVSSITVTEIRIGKVTL